MISGYSGNFLILIALELLLVVWAVIGLFGKNAVYEYDMGMAEQAVSLISGIGLAVWYCMAQKKDKRITKGVA